MAADDGHDVRYAVMHSPSVSALCPMSVDAYKPGKSFSTSGLSKSMVSRERVSWARPQEVGRDATESTTSPLSSCTDASSYPKPSGGIALASVSNCLRWRVIDTTTGPEPPSETPKCQKVLLLF